MKYRVGLYGFHHQILEAKSAADAIAKSGYAHVNEVHKQSPKDPKVWLPVLEGWMPK